MNVVDSSGWLEYFADGPNAGFFAPAIEDLAELVVPSITILEVFRRILQQRDHGDALQAISLMQQGEPAALDEELAIEAARLGVELGLPPADSVVLAAARSRGAVVWTQDADFEGLEGVRYRKSRRRS